MPNALILTRELRKSAHRWSTYQRRFVLAIGMLLALASPYLTIRLQNSGFLTIRETAMFAEMHSAPPRDAVSADDLARPGRVAGAIAEERVRRRLTHLLTTQLTMQRLSWVKWRPGSLSSPVALRPDCRY